MVDRRDVLKLALSSVAMLAAPRAFAQAGKTGTRIVFLGTKGGPRVGIGASNPANLVVVNGTPFVIDCGMGVSRQLVAAGVPLETVKYIFISHHHSDHNLEYGALIYNAWVSGFKGHINSWRRLLSTRSRNHYFYTNLYDIFIRVPDEGRPREE